MPEIKVTIKTNNNQAMIQGQIPDLHKKQQETNWYKWGEARNNRPYRILVKEMLEEEGGKTKAEINSRLADQGHRLPRKNHAEEHTSQNWSSC